MTSDTLTTDTIRKLNAINIDFYNKSALFFDNSRSYNWEGWDMMLDKLDLEHEEHKPIKRAWLRWQKKLGLVEEVAKLVQVLDLGCGNGRFYAYLNRRFNQPFEYIGLDNNEYLIQKAAERYPYNNAKFIVENMGNADHLFKQKFDLTVIFGVMHHIPGTETRVKLLQKARNLIAQNGYLVFTTWQFLNIPRVATSVVKENTDLGKQVYTDLNLDPNELQTNDYILDWQRGITAYRYCHYYTEEEVFKLTQAAGLKILHTYEADGIEGELNKYYICQI
jgi:SAM-dependent methyltransferase